MNSDWKNFYIPHGYSLWYDLFIDSKSLNFDIWSIKNPIIYNKIINNRAFNCIFFGQELSTGIKAFVLVPLAINGDINVSQTHLVCLLGFPGPTRDFFTHIICHQYWWRAANLDQYSAVLFIKEWGFFRVIHLLWHGSYVYMVIQRPVTLMPVG